MTRFPETYRPSDRLGVRRAKFEARQARGGAAIIRFLIVIMATALAAGFLALAFRLQGVL